MGEKVGIDTAVFIYLLESNREYGKRAERVLTAVEHGELEGVFSNIGVLELLVGIKKQGRNDLVVQYKDYLLHFPHMTIAQVNEAIVDSASSLRAQYAITVPDAIHIATALDFGAKRFITNDKKLQSIKEITIDLL
jgi:predicted nucleic acid-binding protein